MAFILSLGIGVTAGTAHADPDKDESGKGRAGEDRKVEFWDGNCKVDANTAATASRKSGIARWLRLARAEGPIWLIGCDCLIPRHG
jgi:hypothetical protein